MRRRFAQWGRSNQTASTLQMENSMIRYCLVFCSAIVLVAGCSSDDKGNGSLDGGDSLSSYTVTFTSTWSVLTHPVDYPTNPHFSALVGATHDSTTVFWADGELATVGIQDMAERGRTSPLTEEVDTAITESAARFILLGGGIATSPGSVSLEFIASAEHPLVTLVSMIAPSPGLVCRRCGPCGSRWRELDRLSHRRPVRLGCGDR